MRRREFLLRSGGAAVLAAGVSGGLGAARAAPPKPDHTIRIEPVSLELAPGKIIRTRGYNGSAPGPTFRLQEGREVTFEVVNATEQEDIVHWHGLFVPSDVDGAPEEGTPMVTPGTSRRYTFTPRPAGTRWYHSHARAGRDLSRSLYAGEFGFLIVEPTRDPAQYDQEVLLAAHHWEPRWSDSKHARKGRPSDVGLQVEYGLASFNDKMLGHGEPVRVREGQHVLFRLLNASATKSIKLALPGHRFTVVALDGNPVPTHAAVEVLRLSPAERVDAVVVMDHPGVWVLGAIEDGERKKGLGVVVEYANRKGQPAWSAPSSTKWDYTTFGNGASPSRPDGQFNLDFAMVPGGKGGISHWTINGKSFPDTTPMVVQEGRRYRMVFNNKSDMSHPVHLHRHSFEITKFAGTRTAGVVKDTVHVPSGKVVEVEFAANDPGLTLFHCHQQDHMDYGFMSLLRYA